MKLDNISVGDRLAYEYEDDDGVRWTQTVTVQNVKPQSVTITFETAEGNVGEKDVSPEKLGETFY